MSGYGGGRSGGSSGREVDPEWVAWAEEQTIKLLRAHARFTYLKPRAGHEDGLAPPEPQEPPKPPQILDRDPIRVVDEIRLDDPEGQSWQPPAVGPDRVIDLADGRRLRLRVHHDHL